MGGLLTQPVTKKRSDQGEGLGLKYGLCSMQGWRPEMEDAHDVRLGLQYGLDDWSFFAVFDGHAGKYAAAFAAWNLLDFILRDSQFELGAEKFSEHNYKKPPIEEYSPVQLNQITDHTTDLPSSSEDNKEEESEKKNNQASKTQELPTSSLDDTCLSPPQKDNSSGCEKDQIKSTKSKFVNSSVIEQLDMVKNAIRSGFLKIDQSIRISAQDMSGCTAVCTLISPTHLFIANCGDSRAVLFDGASPKFSTEDHKPFNPKERKRIIDAGGTATVRINGTLAVSRALGDFEFKKDKERGQCEQLVSPEPEVTVLERHPTDEFLILACDGIWDVMNNEELCLYVRHMLTLESDLEKICSSILDVCLNKGSRDNMSIILIVFGNEPQVSNSSIEKEKKNDQLLLEVSSSLLEKNSAIDWNFQGFVYYLKQEAEHQLTDILPPGAGIEAKYDILREQFLTITSKFQKQQTDKPTTE